MGEEVSLTCPNKASHGAGQREREENKEDIEHGNAYESRYAAENQLGSTDSNVSSSFHARMAEGRGCRKGFASVVGWECTADANNKRCHFYSQRGNGTIERKNSLRFYSRTYLHIFFSK